MDSRKTAYAKLLMIVLLLLLSACQPEAVEVETEVVVTRVITIKPDIEGEQIQVTRIVTSTPHASPIVTVTPSPDFGSIAYDVPHHMVRGEEVQIILLVSPEEGANLEAALKRELAEIEQDPQNIQSATVEVAKYMEARLTGVPESAFEIKPVHREDRQLILEDKPTQWEWTVFPKEGGTHRLVLVIDRLLKEGEEENYINQLTYRDNIEIEVAFTDRVRDSFPWLLIFATAVPFIILLFYFIRRWRGTTIVTGDLVHGDKSVIEEISGEAVAVGKDAKAEIKNDPENNHTE